MKQTLKIMLVVIATMMMTFSGVIATTENENDIIITNTKFTGDKPNFLSNLFKPLSFVNIGVSDSKCVPTGKEYTYKVYEDGETLFGNREKGADRCLTTKDGTYIRFLECEDDLFTLKCNKDLFQELWYKPTSTSTFYWDTMWPFDGIDNTFNPERGNTNIKEMCYTCSVPSTTENTYTCYGDSWRGEPGTQYYGKTGSCENGCKKSTTELKTTDISTIKNELCADIKESTNPGDYDDGNVPTVEEPDTELKINLISIERPPKVTINKEFTVTAVYTAETDGTFYVEAGITPDKKDKSVFGSGQFSINVVSEIGSPCDGDTHWSGRNVVLKAGDTANVKFNLIGREEAGFYELVVGAYTGCGEENAIVRTKGVGIEFTTQSVTTLKDGNLVKTDEINVETTDGSKKSSDKKDATILLKNGDSIITTPEGNILNEYEGNITNIILSIVIVLLIIITIIVYIIKTKRRKRKR